VPEGVEISLLQRILGVRVIAEDGPGDAKQLRVVAPHQAFECRMIAAADTLGELGIVVVVECSGSQCFHAPLN
jgi:hypothetical protein